MKTTYETDWKNIDLNSPFEISHQLITGLSFESLLLEIASNLPEINAQTVLEQFKSDLHSRAKEAKDIFAANLDNIVKYAQEQRNEA